MDVSDHVILNIKGCTLLLASSSILTSEDLTNIEILCRSFPDEHPKVIMRNPFQIADWIIKSLRKDHVKLCYERISSVISIDSEGSGEKDERGLH